MHDCIILYRNEFKDETTFKEILNYFNLDESNDSVILTATLVSPKQRGKENESNCK
jgi:hypothetical protein